MEGKNVVMEEKALTGHGIRFSIQNEGVEVGHAYLYLLSNDLHPAPFGLLEDVYVEEAYRSQGVGNKLVTMVIDRAKELHCYKLIATSRNDGTTKQVQNWYQRRGFLNYGIELRMDF